VTTTLVLNSVSLVLHSTAGTVRREAGGDGRVRSAGGGGAQDGSAAWGSGESCADPRPHDPRRAGRWQLTPRP